MGADGPDVRGPMAALFRPESYVGRVQINGVPDGAEISVDGAVVATSPLAGPLEGVKVGVRGIKVEAKGFAPLKTQVVVKFDQTATLELAMEGVVTNPPAHSDEPIVVPVESESEAEAALPWASIAVGGTGAAIGGAGLLAAIVTGAVAATGETLLITNVIETPTNRNLAWNIARVSWVALALAIVVTGSGGALAAAAFVL